MAQPQVVCYADHPECDEGDREVRSLEDVEGPQGQTSVVRRILARLVGLRRYPKRLILVANDIVIQAMALHIGVAIRYGDWLPRLSTDAIAVMAVAPLLGVLWLFWFRFYRNVTRFMSGRSINLVIIAICAAALSWTALIFATGVSGIPRIALVIYVALSIAGIWASRQVAGWLLRMAGGTVPRAEMHRTPVLIYGAGQAAVALAHAIERSDRYVPIGLTDRNASLWGQFVGGYKVYRPERLTAVIDRRNVKEILIALDASVSRSERLSVIREVEALGVVVRKLPGVDDFASGRISLSDLRPVDAKDLLGREPVPPNQALMRAGVAGRTVLVTGAGGSIGAELCRQLLSLSPARLVLLDASEVALFEIHQQLNDYLKAKHAAATTKGPPPRPIELAMVLGSVRNKVLLRDMLHGYDVNTIYHAAAHKHVPIIEANVVEGLDNNTFGTLTLAEAALEAGVGRFVLVSTDKAVRPTNVMGASKRLAESILQAFAASHPDQTVFTMVRFGNVLDSSGSVVRRFRQQIAAGGPVTVTDPNMIRYFMSIPEAASLVIQAGAMAKGGEVFVLDMGEPVSIDGLARSMIQLAGLKVRDTAQPDGDISIEYVGNRPGEKLREELLLNADARETDHPRIRMSQEPFLKMPELRQELAALRKAMDARQTVEIMAILHRTVEGFRSGQPERDDALAEDDSLGYAWPSTPSKALH